MSEQDDKIDPAEVPDRIAEGASGDDDGPHGIPLRWFLATIVAACLGFGYLGMRGQQAVDNEGRSHHQLQAAESTKDAVAQQAGDLAAQVQAACKSTSSAREALMKLGVCQQAAAVKSNPAASPSSATTRKVSSVAIVDKRLIVTYSTGATADLGAVVGAPGQIGATGQPGKPGKDATGKPGRDGKDGENGDNGVGIVSALPNSAGHLIVTYTTGKTVDAGEVVGPPGKNGENGKDGGPGISVTGVGVSDSYHLLVTLSNGTVTDAGQLPPGPPGHDGADGKDGADGTDGKDGAPAPQITKVACTDDNRWEFDLDNGKQLTADGPCRATTTTTTVTTPPTDPPTSPDPTSTAP